MVLPYSYSSLGSFVPIEGCFDNSLLLITRIFSERRNLLVAVAVNDLGGFSFYCAYS